MIRSIHHTSRSLACWIGTLVVAASGFGLAADSTKPGATVAPTVAGSKTSKTATSVQARPGLPEIVRTQAGDDVDGGVPVKEAIKPVRSRSEWTSADIDIRIERELAASKTVPAPATSDETFLRRLSLDLVGKPPTIPAIRKFNAGAGSTKRAAAIEDLLEDPEFGENWARYWRDVIAFRAPNENEKQVDFPIFVDWLTDQFNQNVPWNKIAAAIITASGRTDENGATAFALAEEVSAVEIAGEVSRVFLGIQIQCAQCHDHPSDPWKRQQFHEFAAFFSGLKRKQVQKPGGGLKSIYEITHAGPNRYAMVDLKDPEKKIPVSPKFFLGEAPHVSETVKTEGRLALAAGYVTSPENPWFARAFINRIWTALIGEGFYDLVDDLGPTRTPHSSEILDGLADQWVQHNYDIRWLYRIILNTRAYSRDSRSTNTAAGQTPFAANVPSRLRADQIYDALSQTFNIDANLNKRAANALAGPKAKAKRGAMAGEGDDKLRKIVEHTFGVDPSTPTGDVAGTIPQALYMMNSPLVTKLVDSNPGSMLTQLLASAGSPKEAIEVLYMKSLARHPNPKELSTCLHYLDNSENRREAFEDILWGLVNSTEYISRR